MGPPAWRCTRRLERSAASDEDEARTSGATTSVRRSIGTTASTSCHCHCTSGRAASEDAGPSPLAWTAGRCGLCERLHGRWGEEEEGAGGEDRSHGEHVREFTGLAAMGRPRTAERCEVHRGPPPKCASSVVRWHSSVRCALEKRGSPRGRSWHGWTPGWTILLLLVLAFPAFAQLRKDSSKASSRDEGVCQSIDIRNNVHHFSRLNGCRIVEGFVQILLIDNAQSSEYANISFPELKEITGYLLLYRVKGLQSIGGLFPNLTVIRGHSLFINYALVAFEMMNLQKIELHSLTTILRGSVRFEKNPALCYVDTIDWDLIAKAGKGEHVIGGNHPKNGCPVCDKNCPARLTKPGETLCWNQQHCQRICERKCENNACDDAGKCCHSSCLGTCVGPTSRDCSVCKDVITAENECKDRCPSGAFEFMNRRCIGEEKCRGMEKPREAFSVKQNYPYKPFNGSCVIECPPGYMDEEVDGKASCKKCKGPCLKECAGANVDNIATAQKLRGCTRITGSLEIQIRGGKNIVKELEDSLSTIEEIDGYLKIVRSFPLISLNFLKNLRVIRGNDVDYNKYTLVVLDNQNLQELWDWSWHPEIRILSKDGPGRVFFHFNPKLCLYKIETLREKAGLNPFTDHEVAPDSNGDKVACNVTELRTRVGTKSPWGAVIEWEPFIHHDARSLLGYVVYFVEAPNRNVTMYDGRDACGGDGWKVDDVPASENASENASAKESASQRSEKPERNVHTHYLTHLKPYTQYAYYVKTYTIATESFGAQSNLTYFRTMPEAPSSPRSLYTWSNSSSELIMSWRPPLHKNGNLTSYKISGRWEPDDPNFIDQRNYCDEPMSLPDKKPISAPDEEEGKRAEAEAEAAAEEEKEQGTVADTRTCECADRETDQSMREKEVSSSIAFEDALHNQVYIKRKTVRRRRDVDGGGQYVSERKSRPSDQPVPDKIENGKILTFERTVSSTNHAYVMRNLRYFTAYNIEVQACRAQEMNDMNKRCSTKSMRTFRTLPMKSADTIPPTTFKSIISGENNSLSTVSLSWEEPVQPNGLIVTYQIEYKRMDIQNIKPMVVCIPRRDFTKAGNSYVLKDLSPGNYSVKVRAMSLAGYGAYTQVDYFYIKERDRLSTSWVFWSSLCTAILAVSVVFAFVCKKKLTCSVRNVTLIATVNPEYVSTAYVLDEWEVPREKIKMLKPLGNGSFGMVYEGIAQDIVKGKPEVRCAVKTINKDATDRERIEFLNEASVMKGFDAHHVVKLLGVVTQGQPPLVIMELMVHGDLKRYLRSHRPDMCENFSNESPKLERILRMAIEIADGMAYLATKKFVHRDLAARNCMVAEDLTVKVGDFGMTRDIYERDYYRKGSKGLLPVRWMAPESLKDGLFSSYSDVWSYGVVLWEMVTFASQPYQGLSNDQVLRYVIEGGVMERPENCPELLYELMKSTWIHKASKRPTFMDIATMLLKRIDLEEFKEVSFYHSPEGIEARNQNRLNSPQNDKHLELATLQDLQEEEPDGKEDSPLRQDFGNFESFEPDSVKNSLGHRYRMDSYGENSKTTSNCHDMNSSNVPLKAGFDAFDGVSGDSIASGTDTLNSPFVEERLKSVKSLPFISMKSMSRGNVSQASTGKCGSLKSIGKQSLVDSSNTSKHRGIPDYENRRPEKMSVAEKRETVPLRVDFPAGETTNNDSSDEKRESLSTAVEYVNKPETLNNGYIGGTTT